jgi:CheY-like chemotaxis protein
MKIQCSPHTISENAELLLRKEDVMEGFRILIGEPLEEKFKQLEREFLKLGQQFRLTQERNGKSLLEYLSAKLSYNQKLPDLILLNMEMPVVNGAKTLELVRANASFSSIPTIVYRIVPEDGVETLVISRGPQNLRSSGFIYSDLKSFVADLSSFLLQLLSGSGDPVLNQTLMPGTNK